MKAAIIKLLKVKSIVTLVLTVVFSYLSICGVIDEDKFMTIFSMVIAFYFGTQYQKVQESQFLQMNESEEVES